MVEEVKSKNKKKSAGELLIKNNFVFKVNVVSNKTFGDE
jgi:hypothetical protein